MVFNNNDMLLSWGLCEFRQILNFVSWGRVEEKYDWNCFGTFWQARYILSQTACVYIVFIADIPEISHH